METIYRPTGVTIALQKDLQPRESKTLTLSRAKLNPAGVVA